MNSELREKVIQSYQEQFGSGPDLIIRAPGRINLLGEHTDYNMGFVLPGAIDKSIYIALGETDGPDSTVISLDFNDSIKFETTNPTRAEKGWGNYVQGVVDQLQKIKMMPGSFKAVFSGDIPIGSGMSSSAALECGFGTGLNRLYSFGLDKKEIAKVGQAAEFAFAGVKCGIMDQFASVLGKQDKVIRIDCRNLEYSYHDLEFPGYELILINSMVEHELASSEYNVRRQECETAVEKLKTQNESIQSLRDAQIQDIERIKAEVEDNVYRRAKFIVNENNRVLKMIDLLSDRDLQSAGSLMYETHEGLSKNYEVSCEELDYLISLAKKESGIVGGRMMGGGFGGCTINLINKSDRDSILERITEAYKSKYDIDPEVYQVNLSDGVHFLENNPV